jgi:hypothetical protein
MMLRIRDVREVGALAASQVVGLVPRACRLLADLAVLEIVFL